MKCQVCEQSFVMTNKIRYSKQCPHCGDKDLHITNKNQQLKELRQILREQYEDQRLVDKVLMETTGTMIFRR